MKFCPNCGQRLVDSASEVSQPQVKQEDVHQPQAPPKRSKMIIAAGVLTILGGLIGGTLLVEILHKLHIYGLLVYLPGVIAGIGGACTLRRVHYGWALAGAICSILFPFFGIPAVVLLVKRKGEFSNVQMDKDSSARARPAVGLATCNGRDNVEATKKKCPHCGQSLDYAAIKCSRCKKSVPNELFDRLCNEDVQLIMNKNLIPFTPSLMAVIAIHTITKNRGFEKRVEKVLGSRLSVRQRFNLLVFESYCFIDAVRLSAKMKQGCKDKIMDTLKDKLLTAIIESSRVKLSDVGNEESARMLKAEGRALYDQYDHILEHLGTDTPSQVTCGKALASLVYGDKQADIFDGLVFYTQFIALSTRLITLYRDYFFVEDEDFNWQAVVNECLPLSVRTLSKVLT